MKKLNFEKLTPEDNTDISSYEEAIEFALSSNMTNIALSGPYGSGKSSVVETYKKRNPEKKYMHISLSHFEGSKKLDTKVLEGKIINQLLHQIKYTKIPKTIFKAKENTSNWKIFFMSFLFLICLISGIIVLNFAYWKGLVIQFYQPKIPPIWIVGTQLRIIACLMFLLSIFFYIYKFIKLQLNQQILKKIVFKGNEIEIFKDSNESYFDKFMNDVVYLFINSGKDIIIFEDLDRFDDSAIYQRLHEINLLVNRRLSMLEKEQKLVFLYLIKDEAFKSKDRTKFFDMIIPIVPVIDSSNSFDKFLTVFKRSGIENDFDNQLLRKMALYIDDMRLLKNINNEYLIYKNRLMDITLDNNKLLAIITYKNLFPDDFSKFQSGVGYINKVISYKQTLIDNRTIEITEEINELESEIQIVEKEILSDINDLDAIFFKNDSDSYYTINDKEEKDFDNRSDFILAIKNNNYIVSRYEPQATYYSINWVKSEINLSNKFEALKENNQYNRKVEIIENKSQIELLRTKKMKQEEKKRNISNCLLSEILDKEKNSFFKDDKFFSEFSSLFDSQYFPIIIFTLREGLIDENYGDYLSYFYESSLKKDDKEFLRGIYDRSPKSIEYKLDNLDSIISNLESGDIRKYGIRNLSLIEYLITNYPENTDYLKEMIVVLRDLNNSDYFKEMYNFFLKENELYKFTETILSFWPTVFTDISSKFSTQIEILYIIYNMAAMSDGMTLEENNNNGELTNYIQKRTIIHPPELSNEQQISLIEKFNKLGIRYYSLEGVDINSIILKKIIELRMFILSMQNLRIVLEAYKVDFKENDFYSSNLTIFSKANPENIYTFFFNDKLNEYIQLYLSFGSSLLKEETGIVIDILNSKELDRLLAFELLKRMIFTEAINDIKDVGISEYWDLMLKGHNVKINGLNVFAYYLKDDYTFSKFLLKAINEEKKEVTFSETVLTDEEKHKLWQSVSSNDEFIGKQYISMLKSLGLTWKNGFSLNVSSEKVSDLIKFNVIQLTEENLVEVIINHPNNVADFVQLNIDKFCEIFSNENVYDFQTIVNLLCEKSLSNKQKTKILNLSKQGISIINSSFNAIIERQILENKYLESDFEYLLKNYSKFSKGVKDLIKRIAIADISKAIESKLDIDKDLLVEILLKSNLVSKGELFSWYIQKFTDKEVFNLIKELGLPIQFITVLDRKRPKFTNSDLNKRILSDYKRRNWITKIEEGEFLRVQGRKILPK